MTKKKKLLVLLDGSSYLFRAYHALPPLVNSKGQPTGAIYGVINMIRRLIKNYQPDYMGVVFDTKEKTFRHVEYKEYKANRPEMPDDLGCQIQPLHDVIEAMGLPLIKKPGFEADDVIGTLAVQAASHDLEVVISTGDKDLAQLVTPDVTLVNTMSDVVLDEKGVAEKFGVTPGQIIDYLTLMGDASDNIPGVPKVGPKTASKWLSQYQSLDNLIEHADEIKGKIGENLRDSIKTLPLSKWLVTIDCDVPLDLSLTDLKMQEEDISRLKDMFAELEFKTWLRNLGDSDSQGRQPLSSDSAKEQKRNYKTIYEVSELKAVLKQAKEQKLICFDLETTSLSTLDASIVGVALALKSFEAFYIPIGHNMTVKAQLDAHEVLSLLKPILEDESILKVGQNLKYDIEVLLNENIQPKGVAFDTMLESYVLNSAGRHDMDSLAQNYLKVETISYEELCGKGAKQIPFADVDVDKASEYAAEDADITMQLHEHLWEGLNDVPTLKKIYETIECPLIEVLVEMERNGVKVDKELLLAQSKQIAKKLEKLEQQAYTLADEEFNLSSPKQLQVILFEKLGLPIVSKTPKGQPSTAENVLQELSHEYELPRLILEHRSLSKLKSTYTDKLPLVIHPSTGRIHTSYHQAGTNTGRLSSSDPNLQNIPIRTPEGQKIRKAFIADKGKKILAADYSQIELRIMAHLSQDEGLVAAFEKGEDIHQFTASQVFDVPLKDVTAEQRRSSKAINFGLIYGMSAFGLAKQLDVSREQADRFMQTYFERYPGIQAYMESTREQASKCGYVETISGRRLYLPEINARNGLRRKAAERAAINAPMQGTAADLIKTAMIDIHRWIQESSLDIKMLMQVHDELVFEVAQDAVDEASASIKQKMESALTLSVPLIVEVGIGDNWQEAH